MKLLNNAMVYAALIVVIPLSAAAQPSPFDYVTVPYPMHSGRHNGSGDATTMVFQSVIELPGASWVQVQFGDYQLGRDSYVMLTSLANGDVHWHDAVSLPQWHNASGIFRGGRVQLELFVAPGDQDVFVEVARVIVPDPDIPPALDPPEDICGDEDDRVPSTDARVGRLFGGGCTGWLVSNGAALTAGHCGTPDGNIVGMMEFNVPQSQSNGTPNPALLIDQYPINQVIDDENSGDQGMDYAVYDLNPNNMTGLTAHEAQGFFRVTLHLPNEGDTVRVTGFGIDNIPPGSGGGPGGNCNGQCNSSAFTQQTDIGLYDALDGTAVEHEVDTEPANSGSPIMYQDGSFAFAIHTDGGCDTIGSEFDNAGTWLAYAPLFNTMVDYIGPNTVMADWFGALGSVYFGTVFHPYQTMSEAVAAVPDGWTIAIVTGTYAGPANTFTAGADGKAMTLTAHLGPVSIGD